MKFLIVGLLLLASPSFAGQASPDCAKPGSCVTQINIPAGADKAGKWVSIPVSGECPASFCSCSPELHVKKDGVDYCKLPTRTELLYLFHPRPKASEIDPRLMLMFEEK